MNKLRWGILGAAVIARKNWRGVRNSGNSAITAVASRDIKRAQQLITDCQAKDPFDTPPVAVDSYEKVLASKDVDAVYIPTPTGIRKEWVIRAAEAGKHVLCEKPCGVSVADVREMIEACRKNRVQFMDGVMFMHNPRLDRIRRAFDDGISVGRIKRITSHFSFFTEGEFQQNNIRANNTLEPLGCLGDLGWYCIRFALWAMNWRLPREVSGRIISQAGGNGKRSSVPFDFSGELLFDDDVSSGFYCSFLAAFGSWATVMGSKGWLRVPDFTLPQKSSEGALEINGELSDDLTINPATTQDTNMIRAFAAQVFSGKLNDAWPEWSLKTQIVTNACLKAGQEGRPVSLEART